MHASHRATRVLVTLCAGVATTITLTASPGAAEPGVDQARNRVESVTDKRDRQAQQVRGLTQDLAAARAALGETRSAVRAHQVALEEIRSLISEESEDTLDLEALAQASEVIRADDPTTALAQVRAEEQEADLAPATAEALTARIEALRDRAFTQDRRADQLRSKATRQGATLRDLRSDVSSAVAALEDAREAAAARASRSAEREAVVPVAPEAPAASGGAATAVSYAMAQVGDSYVYGAAGPDSFDCSGLTMAAWASAGVSLPHSSGAQMGSGTPVSTSALQPGDLVFYYSPVSHVGIYVGNGQIVHAANPSTDVQMAPVFSMPVSGAVRPG